MQRQKWYLTIFCQSHFRMVRLWVTLSARWRNRNKCKTSLEPYWSCPGQETPLTSECTNPKLSLRGSTIASVETKDSETRKDEVSGVPSEPDSPSLRSLTEFLQDTYADSVFRGRTRPDSSTLPSHLVDGCSTVLVPVSFALSLLLNLKLRQFLSPNLIRI